ncbi:Type I phosphodiesterase/nucleotide pyrophosphatase [Candidatus Nitrosotalea okcheonensis]|uniref:Type I phosphodiesterase/nucleotide pyrophosphatase n=1 Tax=Candidatus Nitrosotalea okcheonensis TaxID=1903276 RepID=A0A2H1FFB3_9ARCH|nr:Type I phosphodiesterase/nucleotide pyrophosphatase [Candidatus Nitrosotalea okcheonensis]
MEHRHLNSDLTPNISTLAQKGESAKMEPVFPSVTCTVQASILSGLYPSEHGIIANGLYDRDSHTVSFWEQPSALVQRERLWDILKSKSSNLPSSVKTAVLFWQNTMFANSDIIITPRPLHMGDGSMIQWCYSKPIEYYESVAKSIGEFNLATYWGPMASHRSSEWIGKAAEYTLEKSRPNLMFVYIPHVDYSAQRFGTNSSQVHDDLKKADSIVGNIVEKATKLGMADTTEFIIISEYAFNDVSGAIPLNVKLREAGLLDIRTIGEKEYIDFELSRAFAMVDHQVAHIYVKDDFIDKTYKVLKNIPGVEKILTKKEQKELKIDNQRSGELIAISTKDKWFSYYWWYDIQKAPPFAGTVDIHRKPGYDPLELFFDREKNSIPFDTNLIKGSHGTPANLETGDGLACYVSNHKSGLTKNSSIVKCVDIASHILNNWQIP